MWPWRKEIDLNEPMRAVNSNHLRLQDAIWQATGNDPYLIYTLADQHFVGAWLLDLVTENSVSLRPRIYMHLPNGFSEQAAQHMQWVGPNRYALAVLVPRRCTLIRLDPTESGDASFEIRSFTARPMPIASFLLRAYRHGEEEAPVMTRAIGCLRRVITDLQQRRLSFDIGSQPSRLNSRASYAAWIEMLEKPSTPLECIEEKCRALADPPLISVLMPVYNTPKEMLDAAIESVVEQIYPNWELCIADDASTASWVRPTLEHWRQRDSRIKVAFRERNGHISEATNTAFSLATGECIALLDHDDMLARSALAEVCFALADHPNAEIIYSDEDKCNEGGERYDPYFKPEWSYDLFTGQNYLNHLTVHRAENIRRVGGWRRGFEGSQDYDLSLRIIEMIDQSRIVHIPKVLYHWRTAPGSAALAPMIKDYAYDSARRALLDHIARVKLDATVLPAAVSHYHRLKRQIPNDPPLISLIIPTRDKAAVLRMCVDSILEKTDYPRYEIIIVDNNSIEPETFDYFASLADHRNIRILRYEKPFNFSAINNFAVRAAAGDLVGLINNDMEVINGDWLTEMASHALRPEVGCVGAKLYYPNDTVQHAGVILGIGGVAGHSHKYLTRGAEGYFARLMLVQNLSAVTGACLLVRRDVYLAAGGFDEDNLAVAFNDVDFCLRVRQLGYVNVWTPFAELYHHESVSRGSDAVAGAVERFQKEIFYMLGRWKDQLQNDPYYSVNLTLDREDFSVAVAVRRGAPPESLYRLAAADGARMGQVQ